MKEKHKNGCNTSPRYFRPEKVTWLRLLFVIEFAYPADN